MANHKKHFNVTGVSYFIQSPRVGRSQGASIFWGLISVCFAAAACYYFWKNHENEASTNKLRDQVLQLSEENESLTSQKEHLQADKAEEENQLKAREELVQEKETQLAQEETQIEGMGRQTQVQSQQNLAQVAMVKRFNDAIRKLSPDLGTDVVERGGRPVLRIPNAQLFAPGDSALKPQGKALLTQLAQAVAGQINTFELRVVCYTDADAEGAAASQKNADNNIKAPSTAAWDLTAARAAALSRFYREQTALPFLNVLVLGRGSVEQVVAGAKDDPARNRRVEITVTPLPVPYHPAATPTDASAADNIPIAAIANPDASAPTKKDKTKKPDNKTDAGGSSAGAATRH